MMRFSCGAVVQNLAADFATGFLGQCFRHPWRQRRQGQHNLIPIIRSTRVLPGKPFARSVTFSVHDLCRAPQHRLADDDSEFQFSDLPVLYKN